MTLRCHPFHFPSIALLLVLVMVTAVLGAPSFAAERSFPLTFKTKFIDRLIERVAKETGRTILFDEQVRGNISVITRRDVTESEAWQILESSLSMLGFSLLPSSAGMWRIAKVSDAVGESPFVSRVGTTSESYVTTLVSLEVAKLDSVMAVLEPLAGARVKLVAFAPTHSLIASGPERAIARLMSIARELDRVDEFEMHFRVLRYRDVAEVEPLVEERIAWMGDSARRLQVWSDERTNSILFRGEEDDVARILGFLDRVDRPAQGGGKIQIFRVLNRDPEELATLLRELAKPAGSSSAAAESQINESILAGANFTIAVDKGSRSLVVRAGPTIQIAIRDMLELLDEAPQQIAVDITISELRIPSSLALGFGFNVPISAATSSDDLVGRLIGGAAAGVTLPRPAGSSSQVFGRIARDTGVDITIDDGNGGTISIPIEDTGVIDGGQFSVRNEVLIQPHLIVTAGERHEFFSGLNVPVPVTEQGIGDVDPSNPLGFSLARTIRFDRRDIGIRIGIEVKAGHSGKIQLDLDIEISALGPSAAGPIENVGPTFVEETLVARARLYHGETAILGINRQKNEIVGEIGVPWLSRIPFLGWLFTSKFESVQDVRLIIAARARRLPSPAALVSDSIRRRLAFQRQQAQNGTLYSPDGRSFGVRVTTRVRMDDADSIAEGLELAGHVTVIHDWSYGGNEYHDVVVVSLESMSDAGDVASELMLDGWDPDVILLSTRP